MQKQQHDDWLEWRRNGIGGSDAPVIMGDSPWKKWPQLWNEKVMGIYQTIETPAMRHGKDFEDDTLRHAEAIFGMEFFKRDRLVHPHFYWIRGNLDGIDIEEKVIIEVKNPSRSPEDHVAAIEGRVPEKYYAQCMHYFLLKPSVEKVIYFSRYRGNNAWVEIARDETYLKKLFEAEGHAWSQIVSKIPPKSEEEQIVDLGSNLEWNMALEEWKQSKEAASKEKIAKERLVKIANGRNVQGCGFKMTKQECNGFLDMDRLRSEHPEIDWDSYRKEPFIKWVVKEL